MQSHEYHCDSDILISIVSHRIYQKCTHFITERRNLPLEASEVGQAEGHQSEKQEDPHVVSEAGLARPTPFIPPTCRPSTNPHLRCGSMSPVLP